MRFVLAFAVSSVLVLPAAALTPPPLVCEETDGTVLFYLGGTGGEEKPGFVSYWVKKDGDSGYDVMINCKTLRALFVSDDLNDAGEEFWDEANFSERKYSFRQVVRGLTRTGNEAFIKIQSKDTCACDPKRYQY